MAYGQRDTYGRDISDDFTDDYGVVGFGKRLMARVRRRKKTRAVRARRRKNHKVMRRTSRNLTRKGRRYPHHLKKFMFKKGHKRKA